MQRAEPTAEPTFVQRLRSIFTWPQSSSSTSELDISSSDIEDSSFDAPDEGWKIKEVKIVAVPDFNAERPEWQTIITAKKPGLQIVFETNEQRKNFQTDLGSKIRNNPECPIKDATVIVGADAPHITLDVKDVKDVKDVIGAQTTQEKFAPALAFLTEQYPEFDFNDAISAQLAAEPASSTPITPGLDNAKRGKRSDPPKHNSPRGDEDMKRQDIKGKDDEPSSAPTAAPAPDRGRQEGDSWFSKLRWK